MKLIERTNPNYIQSYVKAKPSCDDDNIKKIIRLNLLSRLFRSIKGDLDEEEIKDSVLPKVTIKVIKVESDKSKNPLFLGSLNNMKSPELEERSLSEKEESLFSDIGIDLPSIDILEDRLKQFSHNDEIDPFRLTYLKVTDLTSESERDISFSELESSEYGFEERMFSGTDYNKRLYNDKVKATCLIAISEHLEGQPHWKLDTNMLDRLTSEIKDPLYKKELKLTLVKFMREPSSRDKMLLEAKESIKLNEPKDKKGKPIATWKIVAGVSLVIFGILAWTQRKAISRANTLANEAKKHNESKTSRFTKSLFTPSGRSTAKDWVQHTDDIKQADKFIRDAKFRVKMAEGEKGLSQNKLDDLNNNLGWK